MLKKLIPIIPIGLSIFVVVLVLVCAVFVKPEPVVPVNPPVVNNDITPTPPIPVPPTPTPPVVDDDLPKVDTSDWKIYRNEKFGYEIKYPEIYSVEDWSEKIIGDDISRNPWYTRTDFLLSFVIFENPTSKCRTGFAFQILNTTDEDKIKSAGGWEFIKKSGIKKIGDLDVYLYSIDSGTNNMQVIFRDGKAYRFLYYHLLEEDFNKMLSTFKFINH